MHIWLSEQTLDVDREISWISSWKETTIGQDTDDIVKNSLFILIRISDKLHALSLIESKKNLVSLKAVFDQRFICGVSKYFSERCCSYL